MQPTLAYAHSKPESTAQLKQCAEDFIVDEMLGFPLSNEGEHVYLLIQKRYENTDTIARMLAKHAQVKPLAVSYSGIKDRQALTTQWFSVQLPGIEAPDWSAIESENIKILETKRHLKKLKRGAHRKNSFIITLKNLTGSHDAIMSACEKVQAFGVPNYFGAQRFGHDYRNVTQAVKLLTQQIKVKDRHKKSLYLSAARSHIFNRVLSERVLNGSWDTGLAGDLMMLDGSNSLFSCELITDDIRKRLGEFDIHPSGPLYGKGTVSPTDEVAEIEDTIFGEEPEIAQGLKACGMQSSRRALRCRVNDLSYQWLDEETLHLSFSLEAGNYATSVLREIVDICN